ncbi:nucleoporin FG repeat region-containing protein [Nitzschia inconspicua]|uniref:Nucleoporin FG repeat region-containing protein n=1 Tax=Nitzschia inconspicua TaxID=303405 RepID=A0A9K3KW63_9STRA|nr:nucleoporin FG repeat region-containing protein [Nitzschia inconspicua]
MPAPRRGAITGASSNNNFSNSTNSSGLSSFSSTSSLSAFDTNADSNTGSQSNNEMSSFSFGGTNTPAPSFSFGGTPATPAPAFGSTTPAPSLSTTPAFGAPASSTGGFSFGNSTPAPSTGAFGAPAPSTGAFGAPNPAPASGGLFGSSAPAAPSTGLFGAPPAPSLFGGSSAPAPSFGGFGGGTSTFGGTAFGASSSMSSTATAFGTPQPPTAAPAIPQQFAQPTLAGQMHYVALPAEHQQTIDRLYSTIMQHKRTMFSVSSMAPRLLDQHAQQADVAAGEVPLPTAIGTLGTDMKQVEVKLEHLKEGVSAVKERHEKTCMQCYENALWPTEVVAARLGVKRVLKPEPTTDEARRTEAEFNHNLQRLLDNTLVEVDQVEKMPSPYLWGLLHEAEHRTLDLHSRVQTLKRTMEAMGSVSPKDENVASIVRAQDNRIWKVGDDIGTVHLKTEELRHLYNRAEKGNNVLVEDRRKKIEYERSIDQEIKKMNILHLKQTASGPGPAPGSSLFGNTTPAPSGGLFGSAPSPGTGFSFGTTSSPAPSGGLFGSSTPAPGGSLFGTSTPAPGPPAPAAGLFGAPSTGNLFGNTNNTSAPSTTTPTPSFGQQSTPAPAGGAPAFPSFGGTPGTTTTTTPLFSGTSSTPRAKNKSRGGTRSRK